MTIIDIKKGASLLSKGLVAEFAPDMVRGVLIELFTSRKMDLKGLTCMIEKDERLWDSLKSEHQAAVKRLAGKVGSLDWLTAEWAINAVRKDVPAVASLFLGWRKARNWLERQLVIIKEQLHQTSS